MNKYKTIQKLCKEKGCSVAQLERDLKFARGSIAKIDEHKPSMEKVAKICSYLDVSTDVLLGGSMNPVVQMVADTTKTIENKIFEVSAGSGRINDEYENTSTMDDGSAIVRICGDSMLPTLHDGDLVRVIPATETTRDEYTIVKINGDEATCKHIEITDTGIWLRGENPDAYTDTFYTVQQVLTLPVQVVGKATEIIQRKL